jgi:hypothetical protein
MDAKERECRSTVWRGGMRYLIDVYYSQPTTTARKQTAKSQRFGHIVRSMSERVGRPPSGLIPGVCSRRGAPPTPATVMRYVAGRRIVLPGELCARIDVVARQDRASWLQRSATGGGLMAIPKEFNFVNEDDFIQRFVIPLLHRLGFSVVANYHRTHGELGKDLVFAEIDRFGHATTAYRPSTRRASV